MAYNNVARLQLRRCILHLFAPFTLYKTFLGMNRNCVIVTLDINFY